MTRFERLRQSKTFWILGATLLVLIGARVALPHVVKSYVNRTLDQLEGYSGRVEGVNLSLWRGAYQIEGVRIVKTGGDVPVPLFAAHTVDLSVAWDALLRGSIVAEIDLYRPELNFVVAPNPEQEQTEASSNWTDTVEDLVPFRIERFTITEGEIHYRDFHSDPQVDIYLQELRASVRNLTNSDDLADDLYARFDVKGLAMGSGDLRLNGRIDPYAEDTTFEVRARLADLDITQLNDFLKAHAKFDAEQGRFSIDAELAASDGGFSGYIKPFIADLQVVDWSDDEKSILTRVWEGVVEVVTDVLEDPPRDTIATRIPLRGQIDDPEVGVWATIGGLLRNAFIESLRRGLEGGIGLDPMDEDDDAGEAN